MTCNNEMRRTRLDSVRLVTLDVEEQIFTKVEVVMGQPIRQQTHSSLS